MKIKIVSDLHKEFETYPDRVLQLDEENHDVLILAGDTHTGTNGVRWAIETFKKPVIYIHGNHEYYKNNFSTLVEENKRLAKGTNVHVLENDAIEIDGVRFLGCTMWTDFNLNGDRVDAMRAAQYSMNDYNQIRFNIDAEVTRRLLPSDTFTRHIKSYKWLKEQLAVKHPRTVVVNHHVPDRMGLNDFRTYGNIEPAYASHLVDLVKKSGAQIWIHGHTHITRDSMIGDVRVVANCRGYVDYEPVFNFNPDFIVEV